MEDVKRVPDRIVYGRNKKPLRIYKLEIIRKKNLKLSHVLEFNWGTGKWENRRLVTAMFVEDDITLTFKILLPWKTLKKLKSKKHPLTSQVVE